MIRAYRWSGTEFGETVVEAGSLPPDAVWLDLQDPTSAEVGVVEAHIGADIPDRADMGEIELSSRLYSTDVADYMTLTLPHDVAEGRKEFSPVSFILAGSRLVTRYADPKSFGIYVAKLCRSAVNGSASAATLERLPAPADGSIPSGAHILVGLLETIVARLADLLEAVAFKLDETSRDIFASSTGRRPLATSAFKVLLHRIGASGELISHLRESLASVARMLPFLQLALDRGREVKNGRQRVKAIARDIESLNDFVSFLSNKTSFLLDTTVGMISIEQNGIIKILSVVSVGFMPPTLVASIYGMNFAHMPELSWRFGYPMALALMVLFAVGPLLFFRIKRWL